MEKHYLQLFSYTAYFASGSYSSCAFKRKPGCLPEPPHRRSRPKLTSWLSYGASNKPEPQPFSIDYFNTIRFCDNENEIRDPDIGQMVATITSKLLQNSNKTLPLDCNTIVLQIIEAYSKVTKQKDELTRLVAEKERAVDKMNTERQDAERQWSEELQAYKQEVKRLELLILEGGEGGLADVIQARQDSIVRYRNKPRGTASKRMDESVHDLVRSSSSDEKRPSTSSSEKVATVEGRESSEVDWIHYF